MDSSPLFLYNRAERRRYRMNITEYINAHEELKAFPFPLVYRVIRVLIEEGLITDQERTA